MFCHECGAEVDDDAKFCKECGAKLSANVPAEKSEINDESKDTEIKTIDEKFASGNEGDNVDEPSKPIETTESKSKEKKTSQLDSQNKKFAIACCVGVIVVFLLVAILSSGHHTTDNATDTNDSSSVDKVNHSSSVDDTEDSKSSSKEPTEEEYKANCTDLDYKNYMKNPSKFLLDDVKVSGEVLQIMEDSTGGTILLYQDGDSSQVIYITYDGSNDVVEDDYITVYGSAYDTHTYTSQANYKITCPFISAKYIEK